MPVVLDCLARKDAQSLSLNEYLEVGPLLQISILKRNRMNKLCVLTDIKKAFLQIRIYTTDRDVQRINRYKD